MAGPFLAAIGIFFLCVGQIPLGIGLIIAGIAALSASAVAENWELFSKDIVLALSKTLGKVAPFIALIGLVFLFVPGFQAIGIGLIIAGLAAFAFSAIAPNWDFILDKLKEAWGGIKTWWKTEVYLPSGTAG